MTKPGRYPEPRVDPETDSNLTENIRVLCVDDEPRILELMASCLEREHDEFTVITETDAAAALRTLAEEDVTCIVSDYKLPGMDGLAFLHAVRGSYEGIPFILYTGKGSEEIASEAMTWGATEYLSKGTGTGQYEILANRIEQAVVAYRARKELDDRDQRFRKLIEGSTDIIMVIDEDGTIQYVSASVEGIMGYEPADLIGEDGFELMYPDDRAKIRRTLDEAVDDSSDTPPERFRYRHADGSWRWVEAHCRNLLEEPAVEGFVFNVRDISERVEREHELERYEVLLEKVADGVSFVDTDGRYSYVNSYIEEKTGYDREELIGAQPTKIMDDETVERFEAGIRELVAGQRDTFRTEFDLQPADSAPYPVEAKVAPVWTNGSFQGTVAVSRDISERKKRERELKRQNERLDEFASVVSHDLRNPLNVAMGRLNQAQDECDSAHLDFVASAHDRMEALIEDVLTLAQKGASIGETERVDVSRIAHDVWMGVKTRDATLETTDAPTVEADANRLGELLANLFRNAVEHGGDAVTVSVGATADGFFVEDDAAGFDTDEPADIFDRGYTTTDQGTGFGLSIVRTIARAHGWEVTATDTAESGARFEITGVDVVH